MMFKCVLLDKIEKDWWVGIYQLNNNDDSVMVYDHVWGILQEVYQKLKTMPKA